MTSCKSINKSTYLRCLRGTTSMLMDITRKFCVKFLCVWIEKHMEVLEVLSIWMSNWSCLHIFCNTTKEMAPPLRSMEETMDY